MTQLQSRAATALDRTHNPALSLANDPYTVKVRAMTDRIDRSGPVKVADGGGWWVDETKPRQITKLPTFDPAKLAKAQADQQEVAKLLGWV